MKKNRNHNVKNEEKNIMKMIKVVSLIITFIIPICFVQHQNYGDIEMNTETANKNHKNKFKNQNKLKKQSKTTQISNTFQRIIHELHEQTHLLCDW